MSLHLVLGGMKKKLGFYLSYYCQLLPSHKHDEEQCRFSRKDEDDDAWNNKNAETTSFRVLLLELMRS